MKLSFALNNDKVVSRQSFESDTDRLSVSTNALNRLYIYVVFLSLVDEIEAMMMQRDTVCPNSGNIELGSVATCGSTATVRIVLSVLRN